MQYFFSPPTHTWEKQSLQTSFNCWVFFLGGGGEKDTEEKTGASKVPLPPSLSTKPHRARLPPTRVLLLPPSRSTAWPALKASRQILGCARHQEAVCKGKKKQLRRPALGLRERFPKQEHCVHVDVGQQRERGGRALLCRECQLSGGWGGEEKKGKKGIPDFRLKRAG